MKLGEEITNVSEHSNDFVKMGLHILKVRLIEKGAAAATISDTIGTFEVFTLSMQTLSSQPSFL
jgi:hypothetical protein